MSSEKKSRDDHVLKDGPEKTEKEDPFVPLVHFFRLQLSHSISIATSSSWPMMPLLLMASRLFL